MLRRNFLRNLFGIGIGLTVAPKLIVNGLQPDPVLLAIDPGNSGWVIARGFDHSNDSLRYMAAKGWNSLHNPRTGENSWIKEITDELS